MPVVVAGSPEEGAETGTFSQILSDVKLHGAVFFNAEFSAPWVYVSPASHHLAPTLAGGAHHLVIYHLVVEGKASARTLEGTAIDLQSGDVVVFLHGDPHVLGNGRAADSPRLDSQTTEKVMTRDLTPLLAGGAESRPGSCAGSWLATRIWGVRS